MLKALIVDDEEWIRLGIKELVDWNNIGIDVVIEASNGSSALEIIDKEDTDIVLTDIRMPVMDGLQLMEKIRSSHPNIILIVISGYSEFEYAKKAVASNAFDYILKPVDKSELERILARAIREITEKKQHNEEIGRLRSYEMEATAARKDTIFERLVSEPVKNVMDLGLELKKSGLNFNYQIMVVSISKVAGMRNGAAEMYEGGGEAASKNVFNAIHQSLGQSDDCIVFKRTGGSGEIVIIHGYKSCTPGLIKVKLRNAYNQAICFVKNKTGFDLCIGIGSVALYMDEIRESYKKALCALQKGMFFYSEGVIFHEDMPQTLKYYIYPPEKKKELLLYLETGQRQRAMSMIKELSNEICSDAFVEPESIKKAVLELIFEMGRSLRKVNLILESTTEGSYIEKINSAETGKELMCFLKDMADRVMMCMEDMEKTEISKKVHGIVKYMKLHYYEKIELKDIADKYFINRSYLSRIFKIETGYNFNNYVNNLRMEKANELLRNEAMKISDVAVMVGYDNMFYFLKKYKDFFGYTPTDFRKIFKK